MTDAAKFEAHKRLGEKLVESLINDHVKEFFSDYGADAPPEATAYRYWEEIKFSTPTSEELAESGRRIGERLAETIPELENADPGIIRDIFMDMVEKSQPDGLSASYRPPERAGLADRAGGSAELLIRESAGSPAENGISVHVKPTQAAYLYELTMCEDVSLPFLEEAYREAAAAAWDVKRGKELIFAFNRGYIGPDAYFAKMRTLNAEMKARLGEGDALDIASSYLDWYAQRTAEAESERLEDLQGRREARFPAPSMFEPSQEAGLPSYTAECGNGTRLELKQGPVGDWTWRSEPHQGKGPEADGAARFGIADSFAAAYSGLYMASASEFAGIVDPASPVRGAVSLADILADKAAMTPPPLESARDRIPAGPVFPNQGISR